MRHELGILLASIVLGTPVLGQAISLSGDVFDGGGGGPLVPNRVYHAVTHLTVPPGRTLTVHGGAIVKFGGEVGGRLLTVRGTLVTNGTTSLPAIFTSDQDDLSGGDSTGNGLTTGSPGDWLGIVMEPTSDHSVLRGANIRFAGETGRYAIRMDDADATLDGCVIEHCRNGAMNLLRNTRRPVVTGCTFRDNGGYAVRNAPLVAVPGFANNAASGNARGDYIRVEEATVSNDMTIAPLNCLNGALVFEVGVGVDVPAGVTLTLESGVVMKWFGAVQMAVDGTLVCNGTASDRVVFTSLGDDDHGGDTNGDGPSAGSPGDWRGLILRGDTSRLSQVLVRYGGRNNNAGLEMLGSNATVDRCTVADGRSHGIAMNQTAGATVTACSLTDNAGFAVHDIPLAAVPGFSDNSATGNARGDYMNVANVPVTADTLILPHQVLNGALVSSWNILITSGATLTLEAGVVLKWDRPRSIDVRSGGLRTLGTAFDPVVFTSIEDDRFAGDTNGDGGATTPMPGAWGGIVFRSGATASRLEHALVRHAGFSSNDGVRADSPSVSVVSTRVEHAAGTGISASALAGDGHDWVAFDCGGRGIELSGGSFDVLHATSVGNRGSGVHKAAGHAGRVTGSISWGNGGANFDGFSAGELRFSDGDAALAGSHGNIFAVPAFVDSSPAAGDLRLRSDSPCLDAADPASALAVVKDHADKPRLIDHSLTGAMLPDMGAFERSAWSMAVAGEPALGETLTFTVTGARAGISIYMVGIGEGATLLPPLGHVLLDTRLAFHLATLPTGTPLPVGLPAQPTFALRTLAFQAATVLPGLPVRGNLTELYIATIRP